MVGSILSPTDTPKCGLRLPLATSLKIIFYQSDMSDGEYIYWLEWSKVVARDVVVKTLRRSGCNTGASR